jgi:hypothetical protein
MNTTADRDRHLNALTVNVSADHFLFHIFLQFMIETSIHAGEVLYRCGIAGNATKDQAAPFKMSILYY